MRHRPRLESKLYLDHYSRRSTFQSQPIQINTTFEHFLAPTKGYRSNISGPYGRQSVVFSTALRMGLGCSGTFVVWPNAIWGPSFNSATQRMGSTRSGTAGKVAAFPISVSSSRSHALGRRDGAEKSCKDDPQSRNEAVNQRESPPPPQADLDVDVRKNTNQANDLGQTRWGATVCSWHRSDWSFQSAKERQPCCNKGKSYQHVLTRPLTERVPSGRRPVRESIGSGWSESKKERHPTVGKTRSLRRNSFTKQIIFPSFNRRLPPSGRALFLRKRKRASHSFQAALKFNYPYSTKIVRPNSSPYLFRSDPDVGNTWSYGARERPAKTKKQNKESWSWWRVALSTPFEKLDGLDPTDTERKMVG